MEGVGVGAEFEGSACLGLPPGTGEGILEPNIESEGENRGEEDGLDINM